MPFKKGNQLATANKGQKKYRTRQWEDIGDFLVTEGSERFMEELKALKGKDYLVGYKDILEYFKPKLARSEVDHSSKGEKIQSVIILPPEEQSNVSK